MMQLTGEKKEMGSENNENNRNNRKEFGRKEKKVLNSIF